MEFLSKISSSRVIVLLGSIWLVSCAALGTIHNPIDCDGVEGEEAYLKRLRGPDSLPISFTRDGSVLGSRVGYVMYDQFSIHSQNGILKKTIYMNMHAGGIEEKPIEGFYLIPSEE